MPHQVKSVQTVPTLGMSASKPPRPTETEGRSYLSEVSWPLTSQDFIQTECHCSRFLEQCAENCALNTLHLPCYLPSFGMALESQALVPISHLCASPFADITDPPLLLSGNVHQGSGGSPSDFPLPFQSHLRVGLLEVWSFLEHFLVHSRCLRNC